LPMPQRSAEDRLGASSGMPPSHLGSSRPPHSSIDPAAGDWQCSGCGNWNWARRSECNKCGAGHPTRPKQPPSKKDQQLNRAVGLDTKGYSTAGDREKRTGEAGGFREFDDEEEVRRKRRAAEAAQEVAERKAERKKCEFCKRFSCIC